MSGGLFKAAATENCSGSHMQGIRTTCAAAKTGVSELDSSVGPSSTCVRSLDRTRFGRPHSGLPLRHYTWHRRHVITTHAESRAALVRRHKRSRTVKCRMCAPTLRDCTHMHPLRAATSFHLLRAGFSSHTQAYLSASVRASKAPQEILGHPRGPLFLIPCTSCLPVPAAHKDGGGNLGGGLTLTPADFGRGCMMRVISGKLMIS